ncbi:hypothetical protein PPACK8108_LOCUS1082 [Phakopsora pachyrhizi]|uniref:Protein kinase domain-containing protein n=1 Tax=Phakopsora pachyrhizi TaxID=170000 RepID=A0AAV0AHE9_PHAPC|nr:hypothetical protein PPACK8108_LOCUS1082 [Phakopsora pachyrhizi]
MVGKFLDDVPNEARELISKLLVILPSERLSVEEIKRHKYFDGIAWSTHQPGSLSSKPVLSGDGQRTIETEPDGGDVASSGGTSSPKVLDLLDADDAQEETGFTQDEFSGELSCLLSKEEKAEQEEDKENV